MTTCAQCKHGLITAHSAQDRCLHANNVNSYPPYALRHDESLCGSGGQWFELRPAPKPEYKADERTKPREAQMEAAALEAKTP